MSAKYIFSPQTVANVPQTTFGNTLAAVGVAVANVDATDRLYAGVCVEIKVPP